MWDLIVSVPDHCLSFYFTCDRIVFYLLVVFFSKRYQVISKFQSFDFITTQSVLLNQNETETEAF